LAQLLDDMAKFFGPPLAPRTRRYPAGLVCIASDKVFQAGDGFGLAEASAYMAERVAVRLADTGS